MKLEYYATKSVRLDVTLRELVELYAQQHEVSSIYKLTSITITSRAGSGEMDSKLIATFSTSIPNTDAPIVAEL